MINIFFYYNNILMTTNSDGTFYLQNRKNIELSDNVNKKQKNLDGFNLSGDNISSTIVGIEGFNNKMTGLMEDGPSRKKPD